MLVSQVLVAKLIVCIRSRHVVFRHIPVPVNSMTIARREECIQRALST